jgi:hypothetical protein
MAMQQEPFLHRVAKSQTLWTLRRLLEHGADAA